MDRDEWHRQQADARRQSHNQPNHKDARAYLEAQARAEANHADMIQQHLIQARHTDEVIQRNTPARDWMNPNGPAPVSRPPVSNFAREQARREIQKYHQDVQRYYQERRDNPTWWQKLWRRD